MSGRAADGETDVNGLDGEGNIRALAFHFQAGGPAESKVCGERFDRSFAGCLATLGPDSHGFFLRRSNRLRYPDCYNLILGLGRIRLRRSIFPPKDTEEAGTWTRTGR